jgi:DNA-binding Lrp family transcriptional regulator
MDSIDRKILTLIQEDFPLVSRPYAWIGETVGCSEEEAFRRVMRMKQAKLIRRIGGSFDSRKLGFVSTLVGMHVPEDDVERVAALISSFPQVTHNYMREDRVNLWFTLIAESEEELNRLLEEIKSRVPEAEILNLPAKKVFKLRVRFDADESPE